MSFHIERRRVFLGPRVLAAALALAVTFAPVAAQQAERVDLNAVYKIKEEGFQRSRVMEIMSWLTDVYGPRLTNSPGFRKAGDWTVKEMTSWGLVNVKLQPFGPFGRGWANDKFYMMATTPGGSLPVIGYAQAWTSSTNGVVSGDAVFATIDTPEDIASWKGKLNGKFLLSAALPIVPALFEAQAQRYTQDQLRDLERETDAAGRGGRGRGGFPGGGRGGAQAFGQTRTQFLKDEGVLAIITPGSGTGGTVFTGGGGSRDANAPATVPAVTIAVEHYGRILRTLQKDQPVRIEMEVKNTFYDDPTSFNVVGEIPGTDKADEVVMLGAHFDSWHAGTGATDNAAGSAVMMEAMRILKQSGLPLRRTVRIGLWGGEEQGLIGSLSFAEDHPEVINGLQVAFNQDNGTWRVEILEAQGFLKAGANLARWVAQLPAEMTDSVRVQVPGPQANAGSDHTSFVCRPAPAFRLQASYSEYRQYTWHTNRDTYDKIVFDDLKNNATMAAMLAYAASEDREKVSRDQSVLPPRPNGEARPWPTCGRARRSAVQP
jgi:carboxypeptidase Q